MKCSFELKKNYIIKKDMKRFYSDVNLEKIKEYLFD